eukprot:6256545-Pyramimonas_sp.AAC.1
MTVTVTTVGTLTHPGASSDHFPVAFSLALPSTTGQLSIPKWFSMRAEYRRMASEQLRTLVLPSNLEEMAHRAKALCATVANAFRQSLKYRQASNDAERLHFDVLAYRGWRGQPWYLRLRAL